MSRSVSTGPLFNPATLNRVIILRRVINYSKIYKSEEEIKLIKAISAGRIGEVRDLLEGGLNPNFQCDLIYSPLLFSIYHRQTRIANDLISAGFDLLARNEKGWTPLIYAIKENNYEVFCLILKNGFDVNHRDDNGYSPLHFVARKEGYDRYFSLLMKKGANLDATCLDGMTPIHLAIQSGIIQNIKILLKYNPRKDLSQYENLFNFLMDTPYRGSKKSEILDLLLNYGFCVPEEKARNTDLIFYAVRDHYYRFTEHLLKQGANPNHCVNGKTPLQISTNDASYEMTKILVDYGGNVMSYHEEALRNAVKHREIELVKFLLNIKEPKSLGQLFHCAVSIDSLSILRYLLSYCKPRFNVNSLFSISAETPSKIGFFGWSLLHLGVMYNSRYCIKELLINEADCNAQDDKGLTPLHLAFILEHYCCALILFKYGAKINSSITNTIPCVHSIGLFYLENLKEYIIAQHSAGLLDRTECFDFLQKFNSFEIQGLYKKYEEEVALMKTYKFANLNVTAYDILIANERKIMKYTRNQLIIEAVESRVLPIVFPLYYKYFKWNMNRGLRRLTLLDDAITELCSVIDSFSVLPTLIHEKILSYLSLEELSIASGCTRSREISTDDI